MKVYYKYDIPFANPEPQEAAKAMEKQLYASSLVEGKIESLDDEIDSLRKAFIRLFNTLNEETQLKVLGDSFEKEPE